MKNITYVTTPEGVDSALLALRHDKRVGFDTETNGLDPLTSDVLLIQLGTPEHQFVFDVYQLGNDMQKVLDVLADPEVCKIAHYMQFDYGMILANFGISMPNVVCTMIGSQLLTKGILNISNSLDECLSKYLNIPISKDKQKSFAGMRLGESFTSDQIEYAGIDVEHLVPLHDRIQSLLDSRGMGELSLLEYETVRACGDMGVNGIFLDRDMWLDLRLQARERANEAEAKLNEHFIPYTGVDIFGRPLVNYNSPVQLKPLLSTIMGEELPNTSEEVLKRFKKHAVVKALLDYREAIKKVTTYGEEFANKHIHPKTGRVHSDFRQLGADSGRMASRDPNLQNVPSEPEYRACFRTQSKDYKLICADFSGQELRLLAYISQEPKFIHALENNMDLHSYSASLIFNIPYENFFYYGEEGKKEALKEVDDLKPEGLGLDKDNAVIDSAGDPIVRPNMKASYRNPAKSITFGLVYGMGVGKLSNELNIPFADARDLMNKYFKTFPNIKKTLDMLVEQAMKNKYALSPLDGRRRIFSGIDWDHDGKVAHLKNIAKNQPFQGAGASVTKLALCRMKKQIEANGWDARLVNCVHDGFRCA